MVTFEYGPIKTHVTSDNSLERKRVFDLLDTRLSYYKDGYFFSPAYEMGVWDGKQHFFSVTTGKLYSGFTSRALQLLKQNGIQYQLEGYPTPLVDTSLIERITLFNGNKPDIELREHQLGAVKQALRFSRGVVQVATNGGKTEIAAAIIKLLGLPPTVYYVPRATLVKQVAERLEMRLRVKVGRMGAGFDKPNPGGITVSMTQTAADRLRKKPKLDWVQIATLMFGDECHLASDGRYQYAIEHTPAPVRILMSGTPFRKNPVERGWVQGYGGPLLAVVHNDELVTKGISAKPNVLYFQVPMNIVRSKTLAMYDYNYALTDCVERNQAIAAFGRAFVACGLQVIIMVRLTEHGKSIQKFIPEATLTHSTASNRNSTEKRIRLGEVFCCIATPIFDTGLDAPNIGAIVYAGGGNDEIRLAQSLGRLLRQDETGKKSPWFVDFKDMYHTVLARHSRTRMKYFKSHKTFNYTEDIAVLPERVYNLFMQELTRIKGKSQ